jgi:uncharacterized protein YbjT (DUF2867 family)
MRILVVGGTGLAGRVLVQRALAAGHSVRVLSRSAAAEVPAGTELVTGDLVTGTGLTAAVSGMDAVVDLSNAPTARYRPASRFFTTATRHLVAAEQSAGVAHHLLLSIVGVDRFPGGGHYRAKVDQEQALWATAEAAGVGFTIARVTQFHDFAAQTYRWFRVGPVVLASPLHLRPVHLADVADHLLGLLDRPVNGQAPELSGPEALNLLDMTRRYAAAQPRPARVLRLPLPPAVRRANDARVLAPPGGRHGALTFDQWLREAHDRVRS